MFQKFKLWTYSFSGTRDQTEKTIEALSIKKGMKIVDVGSGGGQCVVEFAKRVGVDGIVYAIDPDDTLFEAAKEKADKDSLSNIKYLKSEAPWDDIEQGTIDVIFSRNVYHHLTDQRDYFSKIKRILKPTGITVLVDYSRKKRWWSLGSLSGHHTDPAVIKGDMQACGFKVVNEFDFLPKQSFTIFSLLSN